MTSGPDYSVAPDESAVDAWPALLALVPITGTARLLYAAVFKRVLDVVGAALLLLVLFFPMMVIAAAVAKDLGRPIIFRQTRVGLRGRPFTVYKFRTMKPDRRMRQVPFEGPDRRKTHKSANDPRITKVGRFLRRTSLDELPQLWNVLRGEMSLVGPRPELPEIVERYAHWQHQRHLVRPGLTGWWQISGRSELPMHENTEFDIHYVRHLSLKLDVQIIARTIKVVFFGSGAF